MRRYHVGSWYPFPDTLGRIQDPKTTVVVGAILCALPKGISKASPSIPTRCV